MDPNQNSIVRQALDIIEGLSLEDRVSVMEVLQRYWLDQRRMEMGRNAANTLQALGQVGSLWHGG